MRVCPNCGYCECCGRCRPRPWRPCYPLPWEYRPLPSITPCPPSYYPFLGTVAAADTARAVIEGM